MAGKIKRQIIDQIFETARIEEVIGDFVQLKKAGSNFKGLSPFTNEKTPSFFVSPAKQIFKCFSTGKGGNVVSFLMEHDHLSYPEALRFLAKRYNIEIEEDREETPEEKKFLNERQNLEVVSKFAQEFFTDSLHNTEEGRAVGLSYFKERGFSEETIKTFELGYSSDKSNALLEAAKKGQYSIEYLEKSGLVKRSGDRQFDFFRGRVIFPIHNLMGKPIAFGARTLRNDKKTAKYFNSPESELYHKSKVVYGIFQARSAIVKESNCYLVEGYTDVISMHQAGIKNVVASSGTSLTPDQVRLIKRYTDTITILYDGDPAGIKASFRGIDIILEAGMNVKVVLFPEGEDPDSFARQHTEDALRDYLKKEESDFIVFKSKVLQEEAGDDPVKRSELVRSILSSITLIQDSILRSFYIKECARLLDTEERILIMEMNKMLRTKQKKDQGSNFSHEPPPIPTPVAKKEKKLDSRYVEEDILKKLLQYGGQQIVIHILNDKDEQEEVDISVAEYILFELENDEINFRNQEFGRLLQEIRSLDVEEVPALQHRFLNHSNQDIAKITTDLLITPHELSIGWKTHHIFTEMEDRNPQVLEETVTNSVIALKLRNVELMLEHIDKELKEIHDHSKLSDDELILMNKKIKLNKARIHFSKKLTRVFSH